jgi:outer membrane lipoprotein-sorting protein
VSRILHVARLLLPALALALASPASSWAAGNPSVDEIVARHVAACGGLKKIRAIQTLRETGRIAAGADRQALVTRELKRPNRTRFEFTVQGVTGVFVSDGERGWKMSPFEGNQGPTPLPEEVVGEAAEQGDIEGPLVDWKTKGHQVELVGREEIDGRSAYKLKLTLKSGAVRYEYLDAKTFYRLRTVSTRQMRGHPVQIEATFGDYRKTGGVLFPHRIDVAASGRPQRLRVTVDRIEINPPLSDALFEMTESAAPPASNQPSQFE